MANFQQKIREYWATRRPEQQFRIKIGVGLVIFLGAAWVGSNAVKNAHPPAQDLSNSQTILLGTTSKLSAAEQAQRLDALTAQVSKLNQMVSSGANLTKQQVQDLLAQEKPTTPPGGAAPAPAQPPGENPAQQAQIAALQTQISSLQSQLMRQPEPSAAVQQQAAPPSGAAGIVELGGSAATPTGAAPSYAPGSNVPAPPVAPPGVGGQISAQAPKGVMQGLTHIGGQPEEAGHLSVEGGPVRVNSSDEAYLPPGTILTGVTLNGVNVGTGQEAQANPQIIEVRIKKPAIMPNGYRINLNNCMIIATGFGSLAAERIYLRPTTMSCVGPGGVAIESAIKGYVVGDDGISGIRGVVVSHQGELLEKGMMAGLLSGLGSAFSPQTVSPLSINPGSTTQYQYPSVSSVVGNSIGGGVKNAAGMIAQFYIDQAKHLQPTLQSNPGVSVDIILEHGAQIQKKGMTKAGLARVAWETSAQSQAGQNPSDQQAQAAAAISRVATPNPSAPRQPGAQP
jgi:conjugal transfer pilus assembly protein TraB